ncbi:MAG TPA: class I SAM-dependent methyltransferase [Steroidobacteraceae bacterium]|nr:class I SAM-dependent methyltransferase [Steroidobacteraceae bacterium]
MTQNFDAYAAYYDLLYRDKDYPGEARYVNSLLARQGITSGHILELGSGTGKHAEQLARLGYSVHGIDLSPSMVERARQRIPADVQSAVRFDVGDVRSIRLQSRFDAVVALFHVASYQISNCDLRAMLETAATHVRQGGILLFDFWYGPGVLTDPPAVRVKHLDGGPIRITRIAEPVLHPNENLVDVNYTVLVRQRTSEAVAEIKETHRMRYLFLPELQLMLESAGMQLVRAEEWISGKELTCASWQAVVTARRSAANGSGGAVRRV